MNKSKLNYIIDFLAFVSFLITAISGLAIKFFMPSGVRQGRYQEFMGMQKGAWSEIHDVSGILFILLVLIHLILHWDWMVCMTRNFFKAEDCKTENNFHK